MAKRRKDPAYHPDVVRLLEQASRVGASGSVPRKHHLVPESYLVRWAERGTLRVTDVRLGRDYPASPGKAARATDFYSVASEDLDPSDVPPLFFEVLLSQVEPWGIEGIDHLLSDPARPDPDVLARLTCYLGMTMTRGNSMRQQLQRLSEATFQLQYESWGIDEVKALLRRTGEENDEELLASTYQFVQEIQEGTVVASPQEAALVGLAAEMSEELGRQLWLRTWMVCRTPRVLVTCDEPVVIIGGPGHRRDERAGLASAGVVAFPLSPDAVLLMFRNDIAERLDLPAGRVAVGELDHGEVVELNREIAMHCHRWVFERPTKRMAARFNVAADSGTVVLEHRPDLCAVDREGDIIRIHGRSRWQGPLARTPWPVHDFWN